MYDKSKQIGRLIGPVFFMGLALYVAYVAFSSSWIGIGEVAVFGVFWILMCWVFGIGAAIGPFNWNASNTTTFIIVGSILIAIAFGAGGVRIVAGFFAQHWSQPLPV